MVLNFNKIFVIESLDPSVDTLTGTTLYNDVLQYFPIKHPGITAELIKVDNNTELFREFERIKEECTTSDIRPIIHFEIHGLEDKSGLALNSSDLTWEVLYEHLHGIHEASKWNLFLTMAVCFGNYAMKLLLPTKPAPYTQILGSFDELYVSDLELRYVAFYQELFHSLDLEKSLAALQYANPALPADYRFITAENTFKKVIQNYFDTQFTEQKVIDRFRDTITSESITFASPTSQNDFFNKFKTILHSTKKEQYEKDKGIFFMFDKFPANKERYCANWEPNFNS